MKNKRSEADLLLEQYMMELGLGSILEREWKFCPDRKWRFDFALIGAGVKTAIELEGGIWANGRHTRGAGYQGDLDKYNSATALGWRVYRFSTQDVLTGKCLTFLKAEAERCGK